MSQQLKASFGSIQCSVIHASSMEGFSRDGVSRKGKVAVIGDATTASLSVYAPDSALGLLLSIALSSGQVF